MMEVGYIQKSFLTSLTILLILGVYCRASRWTMKPGKDLNSILENYEKLALDLIDETQIKPIAEEKVVAAKGGKTLIHLQIPAFGRTLSMHLHWGETGFTPDAKIVIHGRTAEETVVMDAADLRTGCVEGFLVNEPQSNVQGVILQGAFLGTVSSTIDGDYYVEPASYYFLNVSHSDAIVYRGIDFKSFRNGSDSSMSFVDSLKNTSTRDFMSFKAQDGFDSGFKSNWNGSYSETSRDGSVNGCNISRPYNGSEVTRCVGCPSQSPKFSPRRAGSQAAKESPVKRICKLVAVADHTFYQLLGKKDLKTTVALMEMYVKNVDKMFRDTDFTGDATFDDIHIQMARVEVYRTAHDEHYFATLPNLTFDSYLDNFSMYEYFEDYCAAVAFSYVRIWKTPYGDSVQGEVGGFKRGICGPIYCELNKKYATNVAWVTFDVVAMAVPQGSVNLAHEMGHLFGSLNDEDYEDPKCFIDEADKLYIMASTINKGISQQNKQFSHCSVVSMREVVNDHGMCLDHYRCWDCEAKQGNNDGKRFFDKGSGMSYMGIPRIWILVAIGLHQSFW